ncbi:MAG: 50S ribosomal protein L15e [Candidatus Bathyarchaeota archaeon]|nr:MAG: 50S ribosomal protein L15e [Candidatus Bathyarchaeota archaeon]
MVYRYIAQSWKNAENPQMKQLMKQRIIEWRKQRAIIRVDKPLRLNRARELGYKAKQGIIVARVRVRRSGRRKPRPTSGRRQKRMGTTRYVSAKNMQLIAEERAAKKFPNLEVLNSYWVGEDGLYKWFEVILVSPSAPSIKKDKNLNWICDEAHKGRVHRGLTSAGKKIRGP